MFCKMGRHWSAVPGIQIGGISVFELIFNFWVGFLGFLSVGLFPYMLSDVRLAL